jgi:shikimate 5-dehydrogenase
LIGETFDGVGMVQAIMAHRVLDPATRVLLVGGGGVGQAIAVALALAGVGYLAITNRNPGQGRRPGRPGAACHYRLYGRGRSGL